MVLSSFSKNGLYDVCSVTAVTGIYVLQKFSVHETLPSIDTEFPGLPRDRSIRVYSDVDQVLEHLTDARFEIVESVDEADIVWTKKYLKDFKFVAFEIILLRSESVVSRSM